MPVRSSDERGIHIVSASGPLIGGEAVDALRNALNHAVTSKQEKLLVDLSEVPFVNSTAIGVMMSVYTSYARRAWHVVFSGFTNEVNAVFAITKLTHIFEIAKTRREGMQLLSQR
jgi:anti-sigma B factor antagonist